MTETQPIPVEIYVYTIAGLIGILVFLIGIIGYFLKGAINDQKETMVDHKNILKEMGEILNRLVTNDQLKGKDLETLSEKVDRIEDTVYTVRYDKPNRR